LARLKKSIRSKYKKAVDKSREALADPITIYYRTGNKLATTAGYDPVNKEPLNPDAPGNPTEGTRFNDEIATKIIQATTSWIGLSDKYIPLELAGGQLDVGDVFITCKLADVLLDPADTSSRTIFHDSVKIDVGGEIVKARTTPVKYGLAGEKYSCALVARKESTNIES
jgi:hypothetical protein